MNPKAIIFDLDDTLCLEVDYVRSGFRAVAIWAAEEFGLKAELIEDEYNALFDSGRRTDTFNVWLEKYGFSVSYLDCLVEVYRNHSPRLSPLPDVLQAIPTLESTYLLGLVSDGRAVTQQLKWESLGLGKWFKSVVFSDTLGREHWKPHPLPFITVANQLSVLPGECVYVGDNPAKDFLGARAAGMASIRIRRKMGIHFDVTAVGETQADTEISDLSDLLAAIDTIKK